MVDDLLPVRRPAAKELRIHARQRDRRVEEKIVHVRCARIEAKRGLWRLGCAAARNESGVEPEIGAQHERAIVIDIVAHVVVGGRCLRRRRFQRGMRMDDAGGDVEAGLGDADHSGAPVVVRDVLQQPVDRVVGVRALVDLFWPLGRIEGPHLLEFPFRHVAAARVLVDEDEAVLLKVLGWSERARILVDAVGRDAVRRAGNQERILLGGVFRHIHGGEEPGPVTHGDHVFILRVSRPYEVGA